jgi:hypothetical protein
MATATKKSHQNMKFVIQENIFRFEIPVNDSELVEVLDRGHQLCGVEPGALGRVGGLVVGGKPVDQSEEVAVSGVRDDKVEATRVLKNKQVV